MQQKEIDLSIAIPFFNEEENVETVVTSMCAVMDQAGLSYQLVLVNNGSRDRTGDILDRIATSRIKIVHLIANAGYGGGILTGLHYCTGAYLGYTWGDNQIKAEDVLKVYEQVKAKQTDWGKGVRIERNYSSQRKVISKIYNTLFRFLFKMPSEDINGVPKIFRRDVFETLELTSTDWFIDAEVMFKSKQQKHSFVEVPVVFHKRTEGVSSVDVLTVIEFTVNMVRYWRSQKSSNKRVS